MTNEPDMVLAPNDAHGEPVNSIDLLYGPDHPRELVDVLAARERRMAVAGDTLARLASSLMDRLETETRLDWPKLRRAVEGEILEWERARHG